MTDLLNRYSRTIATASLLEGGGENRHLFMSKTVLLTGDADVLLTSNGKEIATSAIRLLMRVCPNITIALPTECAELSRVLLEIAGKDAPGFKIIARSMPIAMDGFNAILSIGTRANASLPWTVVNSNGWLARVSSGGCDIASQCDQGNAIGAFGAACLGVGEVFKRLIVLMPERGALLDALIFSFWTYESGSEDPGPSLPEDIFVDVLMVGAGAIGNGTAYLLSKLPIRGKALVIDSQCYEEENWSTSICIGPEDFQSPKAEVLATVLRCKLDAVGRKISIQDFRVEWQESNAKIGIVLNGLDEVEPRHQVQKMWPDLIIDGAIGSDLSCQVSCHPWGGDVACLICLFRKSFSSESWEELMSKQSGLPTEFFATPNIAIDQHHIDNAPSAKRDWLSMHIGKAWCSITPQEIAQLLSKETLPVGFAPSVAFVACLSSTLIVTELFRRTMSQFCLPDPRFQFNILRGPQYGIHIPQERHGDCECVRRSTIINRVRESRT